MPPGAHQTRLGAAPVVLPEEDRAEDLEDSLRRQEDRSLHRQEDHNHHRQEDRSRREGGLLH